jgi:hypothetical protein
MSAAIEGQLRKINEQLCADAGKGPSWSSTARQFYTADPTTGASATVAGVSVPGVDGLVIQGRRLWAMQGFGDQITRVRVSPDLSSGVVESHHQLVVPGALNRGPARQQARSGQRRVRRRYPTDRGSARVVLVKR